MYILAEKRAGAISKSVLCVTYGPRVQFGDCCEEMALPIYPILSTEGKISLAQVFRA